MVYVCRHVAMQSNTVVEVTPDRIRSVSLDWAVPHITWHPNAKFFLKENEHYKLIASVVEQLRDALLVDVGTHLGYSALAMAHRCSDANNKIITYDDVDYVRSGSELPHVTRRLVNILDPEHAEELQSLAKNASFIVLDIDPHDGAKEAAFIRNLQEHGFRGLLLLDDIHLNPQMEEMWANTPKNVRRIDLTCMGHYSGSGLLVFDAAFIDVNFKMETPMSGFHAGKML